MKIIFGLFFLVFWSVSVCAQEIKSEELSKLASEISSAQMAVDGKKYTDPTDNQIYTVSFPKENFNVSYSSGLAFKAEYKAAADERLYVTEQIDLSKAKLVVQNKVNNKSALQVVIVTLPDDIVTRIIEKGSIITTLQKRQLDFYYPTGDLTAKNKLVKALSALVNLLTTHAEKYHSLVYGATIEYPDGTYSGSNKGFNKRRYGIGTFKYKDGSVFKGYWEDDRMQGKGILSSRKKVLMSGGDKGPEENSGTYEGEWVNGELNGQGTFTNDLLKYEGNFVDGRMEGKGKMQMHNGNMYEGDWINNKWEGKGIWTSQLGEKYVGDWKNGVKEGKGSLSKSSGFTYDGEWKNGSLNGEGTITNSNGSYQYSGHFLNGQEKGMGTLKDGANTYIGEWSYGMKEGKGEYTWANGDKYIGDWSGDVRKGKGIMYYANGDKYDGEWSSNKKYFHGKYTWSNGDYYTGEWIMDTMERQGVMIYATGAKYEGEWKMGKPDGIGTFYDKDNNKIKAIGLDKPELSTEYLRKKTVALNRDKTYFINYVLTDSTFILYVPGNFSHSIYFDVQNDKKISNGIDLKYQYVSLQGYYYRFYLNNSSYYDKKKSLPIRRDSNNILELTFQLNDIANLRRTVGNTNPKEIAFQIYFSDGDKVVFLPKRKEELDFTEGKMYYIPVNK